LLLCSDHYFFINGQPFPSSDFFNDHFCGVRRQYIALAVIFKLLLCLRNEEGVVFEHLKTSENKLRVGDSTRFASDFLVEDETLYQRNQSINEEVISTILNLFFYDSSTTFIDDTINLSIGVGCRMHGHKVHTFNQSWVGIQKCSLANVLHGCDNLSRERTIAIPAFLFLNNHR
jgi:hypothetical protein